MKNFGGYIEESLAAEVKNEPKSEAAQQARKMGLTYAGFGRYLDSKGKVAYVVEKGKLVPYKGAEDVEKMYDKAFSTDDPIKRKDLEKQADTHAKIRSSIDKQNTKSITELEIKAEKTNKELNKLYTDYLNSLSDFQANALANYSANEFEHINRYLYKGHDEGVDQMRDKDIVDAVTAIDSAIDGAEVPFAYTVYTGLSPRYKAETLQPGEKYIFRGYISSSLSPSMASNFTDETKEKRVILQIELREGQKALHIDAISNSGEMETMLPRGSMVHIVSGPHPVDASILGAGEHTLSMARNSEDDGGLALFHCLLVQDDDE
jgi:hypothetical protein